MRTILMLLLVAVALFSCSQRKSVKPLPVNQMKVIMWDLIKAGEWYTFILAKDSAAGKKKTDVRLFAQVFAVHGVTSEQYYQSYRYYEAHPVEFRVLIDSVDAFSNREKTTLFERQNHGQAR